MYEFQKNKDQYWQALTFKILPQNSSENLLKAYKIFKKYETNEGHAIDTLIRLVKNSKNPLPHLEFM